MLLLTTGSQGEPASALARIAAGAHPTIRLRSDDRVILSAPRYRATTRRSRTIDNLFQRGARVIYSAIKPDMHVSGHASRDELREAPEMKHPQLVAPSHSEHCHRALFSQMAIAAGYVE